jgi:hypothetical protein
VVGLGNIGKNCTEKEKWKMYFNKEKKQEEKGIKSKVKLYLEGKNECQESGYIGPVLSHKPGCLNENSGALAVRKGWGCEE